MFVLIIMISIAIVITGVVVGVITITPHDTSVWVEQPTSHKTMEADELAGIKYFIELELDCNYVEKMINSTDYEIKELWKEQHQYLHC